MITPVEDLLIIFFKNMKDIVTGGHCKVFVIEHDYNKTQYIKISTFGNNVYE